MKVKDLIEQLTGLDGVAEVVIFDNHTLYSIDCVDPIYYDNEVLSRVDLNIGENIT